MMRISGATPESAMLRPGAVLGRQPEREDPESDWLERIADRLGGALHQHTRKPPRRFQAFVSRVLAHADELERLDDAALVEQARRSGQALRRSVVDQALAARAFALVREAAWRALGLRHHPVQLAGGWVLLNGRIAEMETGEGKTLTATLAAATAALAGIPVHVITVNDYLVARDAEQLTPVYERLGLSVGAIAEDMSPDARRVEYARDVTYCSNKQVAFDYLKDRITLGGGRDRLQLELESLHAERSRVGRLMMRGLCFAIIDEADSVLVDEARTPLIISRAGDASFQERIFGQALELARELEQDVDYTVHAREHGVELTEEGRERLAPLALELGGIWAGRQRREELVRQALTAQHLFHRDQHYLVRDDKVQIIDEYTGRVMPDRSWEQGLHQLIEAKEGCSVTGEQETLARISYQRFFRRYLRLAGMTGTASEVAGELWSVYRLPVVRIPTHRPGRRQRLPARVFPNAERKWEAVAARISELNAEGRPVLVGTRSVAASEVLSERLDALGLEHQVLNARQDQEEADIVARAGEAGRITVATNMAGRGTDIVLGPGVAELGGLHVLSTEGHEASRIDRQLFGRCARQGDPGSAEAYLSLEDDLPRQYYPAALRPVLGRMLGGGEGAPRLGDALVRAPQRAAERRHARMRRDTLALDRHLGDLLAFTGPLE